MNFHPKPPRRPYSKKNQDFHSSSKENDGNSKNRGSSQDDFKPFRKNTKPFQKNSKSFRDDSKPFRDDSKPFRKGPRPYRDDSKPFRKSSRPYRDDSKPYRDDSKPYRDDSKPYRDDSKPFRKGSRPYRDDSKPYYNKFKSDSRPYREKPRKFRNYEENSRPFREDSREDSKNFRERKQFDKPKDSTDWNQVSQWYDQLVGEQGTDYQREVIFPGALKMMKLAPNSTVLDLACGQGVFCRELFYTREHQVFGIDAAKELIDIAKQRSPEEISFFVQDAKTVSSLSLPAMDVVVCLLAIQNMDPLVEIFRECFKVLKPEGRLVLIMNHPCFRIPKQSHWGYEKGVQFRRIDRYLSDIKIPIVTHPGLDPDAHTLSFHRPISRYFQALVENGFLVDGLEEFVSHRFTDSGPRASAENLARMEIPLFLGLSAKKISLQGK